MSASPSSVVRDSRLPKRLRWICWASLAVLAVVAGVLIGLLTGSRRPPAVPAAVATPPPVSWATGKRRAANFRLTDQHGASVSLAEFRGRPVIVTFIDPLCRNFCPLEAQQLNALVHRLPAGQRPAIVAVSVNVYGDAAANLRQDATKWRLTSEWRWGVGTSRQLASVWRAYRIGVLVTTKKIAGVTVHEISHTEAAYVVDRRGFMRALFLWPFNAGDVAAVLRQLEP